MNILIIAPADTSSFWNLNSTLNAFSKKPTFPLKELLVISNLLPINWERKIVDMNHDKLRKATIRWADYIFINANENQYNSAIKTIARFSALNKKVVACGALFTEYFEEFENTTHLVLDNIRTTLPQFISDLENEKPQKVYHSNPFFEIRKISESYYSLANFASKFSEGIQIA